MALDYSRFDNVEDSGDEEEREAQRLCDLLDAEAPERAAAAERFEKWLRRWTDRALREENSGPRERGGKPQEPGRRLTYEDRTAVAMLAVLAHADNCDGGFDRAKPMLELCRRHQFLQDPSTLSLLLRTNHLVLREKHDAEETGIRAPEKGKDNGEQDLAEMLLCAVNILAAPKRAKMPNLLSLFSEISLPTTDVQLDLRKRFQEKAFAKDELFDSLFGHLGLGGDEDALDGDEEGWGDMGLILGLLGCLVVLGLVILALVYSGYIRPPSRRKGGAGTGGRPRPGGGEL